MVTWCPHGAGWAGLGWAGTGTETSPVLPYTVSSSSSSTQQPTPGTTPGDITCTRHASGHSANASLCSDPRNVEHGLLIYLHDGALVAVLVQAEECQVPRSNVWKICAAAAIQTPCKNT